MRYFRIPSCLAWCFLGAFGASAQALPYSHSPLFTGNGVYSEKFTDLFSFLNNSAALALDKRAGAGVYAENKYGLNELNNFLAVVRTGNSGIGGFMGYAGDKDLNRSQLGLAYGKNLGKISVGVRFNYNMIKIAGYGNEHSISYELGSLWKITEKFFSGIRVFEKSYSMGVGYECSDQLYITTSIIKEEDRPVNVQAGIQYLIVKALQASIGINTAISSPCFLLGWLWKGMRISVSGSMHPQLGLTSGFAIIFYKKEKSL